MLFRFVGQVGQRLVAADIDGSEDDRPVARGFEDLGVEPLLPVAPRKRGGHEELELGPEQADPVGPAHRQGRGILGKAGVDHHADLHPVAGPGGKRPHRGELGAALLADRHAMLEAGGQRPGRTDDHAAVVAVDEDRLAFLDAVADVVEAADHRHSDRARDDHHVRGQRAFLEQHGLEPSPVIFEQVGGAEVARDQHRVAA